MDALSLARWQFAITTVYHFFFVPLTLGLSILVALMETMYVRTGQEVYLRMTKFWGKLFVINFALGVVTGIVQEFQFGMNWSEYSRFVGDIFGAPLAIEALLAFFLESVFLGIWIFGWDRLSKGLHAAAIWLVAIGTNISALWILIANSFMQEPSGYVLSNGRAEMDSFLNLVLNPNIFVQFPHTLLAGYTTAAFFVMGISAYHLIKNKESDVFRRSFRIAAIVGSIAITLVILIGHRQAQHMVESQPMKMASAEALFTTESPASFSLLTIGDLSLRQEVWSLRLPGGLCLLIYNRVDCEVKGIYNLQQEFEATYGAGNYIPLVAVVYWSFRFMVGAGFLMFGLALYALFKVKRKITTTRSIFLRVFVFAIALPYIANTTGWLMTESGRYPWIVYGLMKIEDGLSIAVSTGEVALTLTGFTLIYAALILANIYLMVKYAKASPEEVDAGGQPGLDEQLPSLVGAQD